MFAEIITIGDEILIGQIIDTNSAYIAQELNKIGISVFQISSVQDNKDHILLALKEAESRADIIIVTGGLGPTKDDITKFTICEYFGDTLVQDTEVLRHLEDLFKNYFSAPISEINRKQALVPSKAIVLKNEFGTAPGMWLEKGDKIFVSLPGVPFEMKGLMLNEVIPKLLRDFKREYILHKTFITYGVGESTIAEKIATWEDGLPNFIKLAYLPNLGMVRLRLTAKGGDNTVLDKAVEAESKKLYGLIGDIIYGEEDGDSLEGLVAKVMTQKGMTLAIAESFTGGKIAQQITAIPGASAYFKGGIVSYATETKIEVLHVAPELVKKHSVVSKEVAESMAINVRKMMKSDFAIATTGNAGPTKGDSDADVGSVFIAIASPSGVSAQRFTMGNHRERIVQKSVNKAFELLQKEILKF
ncbi:competence/damage-inducible protein A [Flavobacteriaceae bacterium F89]|uniref:CinA-like protein n=1 Tax=Cerina litoralis TaxID=2874477 RepID=A0AAE3JN51_9FLAO|nr:competence/damage-inducible protein A [Cerina litoralis]MCG2459524.1 competence/damage-inducible protein A [Cerina litoralis]